METGGAKALDRPRSAGTRFASLKGHLKHLGWVPFLLLLLGATAALGDPSGEDAAYRKVVACRDDARRFRTPGALGTFELAARGFLERYPKGGRASDVSLWLGDFLKAGRPREAYGFYRKSRLPEAGRRAAAVAFRHEAPPPLEAERWLEKEAFVLDSVDGTVKAVVFFSAAHFQTQLLLPELDELHRRFGPKGLRLAGMASVLDEHKRQTPERIERKLEQWRLPFPVGIDKQRPHGARSVSLEIYGGRKVPWLVLVDRYGRIAWQEDMTLKGNGYARLIGTLESLLKQPGYEELVAQLRSGRVDALEALKSIRTRATVDALVRSLEGQQSDSLRELTVVVLRGLLPEGYFGRDEEVHAGLARWPSVREKYRYSFEADRLVAKGER